MKIEGKIIMKIVRILLKSVVALFLAVVTLWIAALIALQTKPAQKWLLNTTLNYIEQKTGTLVEMGDIELVFPLTIRINKLSFTQNQEKLITFDKVVASCAYGALLEGRILFSSFYADGIHLIKKPLLADNHSSQLSQTWDGQTLPFYIKIENLFLNNITVDPSLINQLELSTPFKRMISHSKLSIKGFISNNPFRRGITSHLNFFIEDEAHASQPIHLVLHTQRKILTLTFEGNRLPKGVTDHLSLDSKFEILASAPITAWTNLFTGASSPQEPLEGWFKFALRPLDPQSSLAPLLTELTRFEGTFAIQNDRSFILKEGVIKNALINLSGHAKLSRDLMIEESEFKGDLRGIHAIHPILAQNSDIPFSFDGSVKGSINQPSLVLKLYAPALKINDQMMTSFNASLTSFPNQNSCDGSLDVSFDFQQEPCRLSTLFELSSDKLMIDQLEMDALNSTLRGQLALSLPDHQIDGIILFDFPQLETWSTFLSQPLKGKAKGDVQFFPLNDHKQAVDIALMTDFLQINDFHSDKLETLLYFELDKNRSERPFKLQAGGFWNENWTAHATGDWLFDDTGLAVHLNQFSGNLGPYPFQLLKPLTFVQNDQHFNLDLLSIQLSDAILNASFNKQNDHLLFDFKTTPIPTELFHFVHSDFPLSGRLSLSGAINGPIQNPEGQVHLLLHHAQFTEQIFEKKPFIEGNIDLALHDHGIDVQSNIQGIGNSPVIVKGTLPITTRLAPFEFKLNPHQFFSLDLQAEGELDPYLHLFYNDITNLSGQTKIALNLSGQIDDPMIKGSVDLYNGAFESLDTGAIYNNIQAHLEGQGQKILLTRFIAHDNKEGSISATGEITIDKNNDFPFDFKIQPSKIYILESDYANISVSGPLTLSGNRHKSILKGELTADDATIHLEQALPKQIKHIDIQYINEQEGEKHLVANKKQDDFIELDVNLSLPNKVMIEGKNLTSEWKGNIALTGTPDDLLLNGDIRIVKGEYNLNGKVFTFTQGNIHFAGSPSKKTSLYIIAGKDIDNIHAEIIVKGPVTKPVLSFRSNPPLSQREVLSYILFNRGIADITQDQGDQLSQSFIELSESDQSTKSSDLLSRLRNNIGIDRLDITSSDSTNKDVSLQVGKYITDSVFVSINKSISDIGNRVAIEANLRKNLKAEAEVEVGGETQGKVSLKWKKDY